MGNYCCFKKTHKNRIVLLLLGLDNAGKTVAAKNLAGESTKDVVPTVGFSIISLSYMNFSVEVFDLGGGLNIRGIWTQYFVDAHGIIFVVDSSDYSRLNEVKEVLYNLVSHEKVSGKPLLLLANKQDNENALDELDLIENLELEYLVNKEHCPTLVESCSATAASSKLQLDPGIKKGYNWLLNYIIREYETLNTRVQQDVNEQQITETSTRQKILERLHMLDKKEKQKQTENVSELYSEYNMKFNNMNTESTYINSVDTSSAYSSDSLPLTYCGTSDGLNNENRPRTATQIIKDQLQLEYHQRKLSLSKLSNKTEPINLLGTKLSHSAHVSHKIISNSHRALKSADDSEFVVPYISNVYNIDGSDVHKQLFEMTRTEVKKLAFFKEKCDTTTQYTDNSLNIIDVD